MLGMFEDFVDSGEGNQNVNNFGHHAVHAPEPGADVSVE